MGLWQGGRTPLLWAAAEGKAHVVELLLERGANMDAQTKVRPREESVSCTPRPCSDGVVACVCPLTLRVHQSGNTALSRAAAYGHADVAKVLLAAGAEVGARNSDGLTPLHRACRWGHADVVEVLLGAGAKVALIDNVSGVPWSAFAGTDACV